MRALIRHIGDLPLPGAGRSLDRWRVLADVAAMDVTAVKLYEGHADAVAILAELDPAGRHDRMARAQVDGAPVWAVWAAQPPDARVEGAASKEGVTLTGRKAWCSGAAWVTHALVTYFDEAGDAALAAVHMGAPGVRVTDEGWRAVGMGGTGSVDVCFDRTPAWPVGQAGAYVSRPGFWHGGAGIAACWYGAALPLARALAAAQARRPEPHALAHLGRVDMSLRQVAALLRETAGAIDQDPRGDARTWALRVRAAAEAAASGVLEAAGKALGPAPFCRDAALARRYADLPIFLRQSHAERDLAQLGHDVARGALLEDTWQL
ncbi:acyl-CoA dehydrogenase [Achromobacter aloeverae]|uniref:Acyl-CoA dehydrogenase n=1 Tax=Achromobacter aloeverae TaxID=1750518 RepID=A0A4Q1HFI4_9BURK|nr:acyl-CoA dehydrogenase [Achromobacter aloeverae]